MSIFAQAVHPLANEGVVELLALAHNERASLTLVGGYVRDAILGRLTPSSFFDLDFVVEGASVVDLATRFAKKAGGRAIMLDEATSTMRVLLPDGTCTDLSALRGRTLAEDLHRRDFTINAIAWSPEQPERIYDPLGGVDDARARLVRATTAGAYRDDPLRLLRTFRFAGTLNFDIDATTLAWVDEHKALINNVAAERISYELFTLLACDSASRPVRLMAACGLLEEIFPELRQCRSVTKNAYHHLGLFDHSIEAVIQCERAMSSLPDWAQEHINQPLSGPVTRLAATKLACLLHDIGKPETWIITPEGKHTFIGHDKLGADMCEPITKRLRWARPVFQLIEKLVRWHLRPGHLFNQGAPTDKALYKFFRTIEDDLPELILLALSDFRSTCGPGLQEGREENERQWIELLDRYCVYRAGAKTQPRLIDGNEVMTILGIKPGPVVGEILEELTEAIALGQVTNRTEAEAFVRSKFAEKYSR